MTESRYDAGLQVRKDVLGAEYVDNAINNATDFNAEFQRFVTEYCWGGVWTRPVLDKRTRSLLNLAMMPALKQWGEFRLHLAGAINNGVSTEEIREVLMQVAVYCGVPAGVEAFKIAGALLPELTAAGS